MNNTEQYRLLATGPGTCGDVCLTTAGRGGHRLPLPVQYVLPTSVFEEAVGFYSPGLSRRELNRVSVSCRSSFNSPAL